MADQPQRAEEQAQVWAAMDDLADEVAARWPAGVSAAAAVAEQRRAKICHLTLLPLDSVATKLRPH